MQGVQVSAPFGKYSAAAEVLGLARGGEVMASFEEQLTALETVVERLERGELSLEETVRLFEEGVKLSNACKAELANAESGFRC